MRDLRKDKIEKVCKHCRSIDTIISLGNGVYACCNCGETNENGNVLVEEGE